MILVWPRYSCRVCEHGDRTRGSKVSRRSQLEPPIPGERAHQRKPNSRPSFIDANILFDLDALETRHVRVHVRAPPGNNWPSERVGSPGTALRRITEFQTHAALSTFVFFYYRATMFSSLKRRRQSKCKNRGICRCVHGIHGYKDRDLSVQTASNLRNFLFNGSHQAEFRCVEFQRAILLYFRIASFYFGV